MLKPRQIVDDIREWLASRGVFLESDDMIVPALQHMLELAEQRYKEAMDKTA